MGLPSFFPHAPRPHQPELVAFLRDALEAGEPGTAPFHAVVESGTGTGKTVCALSAALDVARRRDLRVVYLTRTNSQARQVMVEFRAMRARDAGLGPAVALQGRTHLCPLRQEDGDVAEADAEELGVMCRDRMRAAEAVAVGERPARNLPACPFHLRGLEEGSEDLLAWARDEAPDAEAFAAGVVARGQCPHVLSRRLLAEARLVVAPYVYFMHPQLRGAFLRWMGAAPSDLVVVVDEAHNLPDYARELATPRLAARTVERAITETRAFGDPTMLGDVPLSLVLRRLKDVLVEIRETHLGDGADDALLPPDEFHVMLLSTLRASTPALDRALLRMEEYAAAVREARRRQGKVPRSHVGTVATFLRAHRALDPDTHVALVERGRDDWARLAAFALDPAVVTDVLDETAGSLHLSGTLHPLEEYRETMGLPRARTRVNRFPSPFPRENRLVVVDEEVTTRHEDVAADPDLWREMGERLRAVRAATDRNVAVFLPSYDVLHRLAPYVRGSGAFVEVRGERQDALMARLAAFKATRGATLVSVIGGRVSEGLDFPDDELEVVVVVGLPYGKPSARSEALVRFYERRFARGWEWAVKAPMQRRLQQAAGRLIRSPTDRGVVVLLDRRAAMLREAFPDAVVTRDPASLTRSFFAVGKASSGKRPFGGPRSF